MRYYSRISFTFSLNLAIAVGEGMCYGSPVLDELIAQFATDGVASGPGFAESCHKISLIKKSHGPSPVTVCWRIEVPAALMFSNGPKGG